jgi:STE24 endopeptidase
MYNIYFYIIISFLVIFTAFDKIVDYLNSKNWSDKLPDELKEIYDEEKYKKAREYDKADDKLSNISSLFTFLIIFLVLIF